MNQVFDLPIEEYIYLSGKQSAKGDGAQASQAQSQVAPTNPSQPGQITPHQPNLANQSQAPRRSGPRLVQSPIFQIPRDDQPIGQHLQQAQQGASQLVTEPVAPTPSPVAQTRAPVVPRPQPGAGPIQAPPPRPSPAQMAQPSPAPAPAPIQAAQTAAPVAAPMPPRPAAVEPSVQRRPNPAFANSPPPRSAAQTATPTAVVNQPAPTQPVPIPVTPTAGPPVNINVQLPPNSPVQAMPPAPQVNQQVPRAPMTQTRPPNVAPIAPAANPAPMMPAAQPAPARMAQPASLPVAAPIANPIKTPSLPQAQPQATPRPPMPQQPAAVTTAPPPSAPPPIQSIATNNRFGSIPPVSSAQPGEVTLPEVNSAPASLPMSGISGKPPEIKMPGSPIANSDPPPSFQTAGLVNKSAGNTSHKTSDKSGNRGSSAISQKTRSIGVAIRAAALAKPVMVGGVNSADVPIHDPDFGIYSHSEQIRQRHYYSRLTLNLIVILFVGVAVISAWSFWPKMAGWWSGITTTDQQYFDDIIDGLLTTDIQKYDVELDTAIDQFGQTDGATITGEFIAIQTDPLVSNPSQSSIELNFENQVSVATANALARYDTIVLGVDQINNPVEQSRYIRVRPNEFNQQSISLTDLHQTWTKLGDNEVLDDNQQWLLLELADDLERNYSHYDYTLLLPAVNLEDAGQREEAKQYLLDNPPYHPFDCRVDGPADSNLVTCRILVQKDKVQQFYRHLYTEILEAEAIPARYDNSDLIEKLPDRFHLTIDTSENRPVKVVAVLNRDVGGNVLPDKLTINYQSGGDETIEIPNQPQSLDGYRQKVKQFQIDNANLFN